MVSHFSPSRGQRGLVSGTVEHDDVPPVGERESLPVGRDPHVIELVRTVNGLP